MHGTMGGPPRQDFLYKALVGSLTLHLLVIILALFVFKPQASRTFFAPVYTVSLVEPAPVKKKTPPRTPEPKPKPKPVKKAPPPPPPKKVEKPKPEPAKKVKVKAPEPVKKEPVKKTAASKEKADVTVKKAAPAEKAAEKAPEEEVSVADAIASLREKAEREEERDLVSRRIEELRKKEELEDARVSKSLEELRRELAEKAEKAASRPAPSGRVTRENLRASFPAYYKAVHDRVWENWAYPVSSDTDTSVIISIRIGRDGKLLSSYIEESSGRELLDRSLMNAIEKAAPFPPLPEGIEGEFLETGLRFCPGCGE